jgi:hypothetical protein
MSHYFGFGNLNLEKLGMEEAGAMTGQSPSGKF